MPSWRIEHVARRCRRVPCEAAARPTNASATFFRVESADAGARLGAAGASRSTATRPRVRASTIVRRRSGGGGVLLMPGEFVWLDLEIPAGDALWHDDVGRSMWWVGELWRARARHARAVSPRCIEVRCSARSGRPTSASPASGPGEVMRRRRQAGGDLATPHPPRRSVPDDVPPTLATRRRCSLVCGSPPVEELATLVATCPASSESITAALTESLPLPSRRRDPDCQFRIAPVTRSGAS